MLLKILGATIFGGINSERLQLNEQTVWTGKDVDFVNPAAKAARVSYKPSCTNKRWQRWAYNGVD